MKYLIILLLFASCSPLRHYKAVALDKFRNEEERHLLAMASLSEFPNIRDTPTVSVVVDSTGYKEINEAYNTLVQDYINHVEADTARIDTNRIYTGTDNRITLIKMLRQLKPATITRTITKEIPIPDSRKENQLKTQLNACSNENQGLVIQAKSAKENQRRTRTTNIWLYIVGGLLAIGNVAQLFSKKKLLV